MRQRYFDTFFLLRERGRERERKQKVEGRRVRATPPVISYILLHLALLIFGIRSVYFGVHLFCRFKGKHERKMSSFFTRQLATV